MAETRPATAPQAEDRTKDSLFSPIPLGPQFSETEAYQKTLAREAIEGFSSLSKDVTTPGSAEDKFAKQADAAMLAKADPAKLHDLHMIMPSVGRSEHLDLFEKGIARKLDFSFAGTQSLRISQLLEDGLLEVGAIHTYIELYARLVVDLIPNVVLSAGFMADRAGNIYTGASTEDTPALIEPAAFSDGIVIVQVERGAIGVRVFFSTDATMSPADILCGYANRWSIEVCFRDLKQLLVNFVSFEDFYSRERKAIFQIGTLCFRLSIAKRQASKAASRCGAAATITTAASPISSRPTRWSMSSASATASRSSRAGSPSGPGGARQSTASRGCTA